MATRDHLRLGGGGVGADDLGDVEPCDARQVGDGQPDGRIDVGLRRAAGRSQLGELAGGIPVQRTLAGQRFGQVAEHGEGRERVVRGLVSPFGWTFGHGSMLGAATRLSSLAMALEPVAAPLRVHVTGAEANLGTRVLALLAAEPGVTEGTPTACDVVVHLGAGDHDLRARRRESVTEGAAVMLQDATERRATHVVLVSSAMVYGAYANNPVPLTEEAILRPDVEFVYARQLATVEAMVDRWRRSAPSRSVTVLRPVVAMAADGSSSLARALAAGLGQRFGEDDPAAQFLHLDDLASAVAMAVVERLDGVFNVAPDGWVPAERVRALTGKGPRVKLPDRLAEVVSNLRWRFQRGPIPPGLRGYTREPWLVANDRLKAHGWVPTVTNEQAYVEGTEGRWWTMVTPKRRQELALTAMVAATLGVGAVVVSLIRRWRRRRA